MDTFQNKTLTIGHLTAHAGAYAVADDGFQCYVPTGLRDALGVSSGDRYFATVKDNYAEHRATSKYIAVRLYPEHPQSTIAGGDDDDTPVILVEETDLTTEIDERDLPDAAATRSLSEARDQMFSILATMPDAELSDLIIETLSVEPMGFVDVLWSLLSISPVRHKDMNDLQRRCYERVNNKCASLHQAGKLVQAKYTTYNHEGKSNITVVYGARLSQLDPTQV